MDAFSGFLDKIKKTIASLFLLVFLSMPIAAVAQNPFTAKPEKQPAPSYEAQIAFLDQINNWQRKLHEQMSSLVRQAEATGSIRPILLLIMTAFGYGMIHAVGPGHGKAIALSYVLSQKPSYSRGLLFGASIGLFHGISGIVFVLVIRVILETNLVKNLEMVTNITQVICYGMIAGLGCWIFLRGMYALIKKDAQKGRLSEAGESRRSLGTVWPAFVVGCIPCPGVVMVMLFALSMDLVVLGILLGVAISVGMALTLSMVVFVALYGKTASLNVVAKKGGRMVVAEHAFQALAGFLLTTLGILFLAAAF